ncbi:MAG: peptidoglycan-binding domain-containing protein [Acidimicrobiia bacterium]
MLKRGSSGPEVEDLQRKLLANKINPGPVDGLFGPKTDDAVRRFQEMHDLQVDGIVGPNTLSAFEAAAANTAASLAQAKDAQAADAAKKAGEAAADARSKAAQERADAARRASEQQASSKATSKEAEAKKSVDKAGGIFSRVFKRGTDK